VVPNTTKPTEASTPVEQVGKPIKILVVEDNKPTLLILQRFLKRLNHEVVTAMTVADALKAASDHKGEFDLLMSDIGLPDGNGLELMKQIKELYNLKGIALSGYGTEVDITKSLEAGFKLHLTKPVQISVLERAIIEVLSYDKHKRKSAGYK